MGQIRSSVLPILREHGQLVRYWKVLSRTIQTADIGSAKRVDDETGFPVVLFQHLTGQKLATRAKVTD